MAEGIVQIVYYINSVIYLGMTYYAFTCIFEPITKKRWILLIYIGFFAIASSPAFHFESGWINFAVNTLFFLSVAFLFSGGLWIRFLFSSMLYASSILATTTSFLSLNYIYYYQYGTNVPMEYIHSIGRTVTNVIFLPLLLASIMLFRKLLKGKIQASYFKAPVAYTSSVFLMLAGIILIDLLFILAAMAEMHINAIPIIIGQLAILFFIIWLYYTIRGHLDALEKSRLKDRMLERWEMQYQTVLSAQKVIAKLNHNLRFHFLALSGFLNKGEIEEAKAHIAAQIGNVNYIINTGNMSIDAMLNYYKQRVENALGIQLKADVQIPANMKLDANLIVTILGNAMENAMDACQQVAQSSRYIQVKATITENAALMIVIENPYTAEPLLDKEGNLMTTKADKENHGLGLASIREILSEDVGHIHYEYANNCFRFMLLYYDILEKDVLNVTFV